MSYGKSIKKKKKEKEDNIINEIISITSRANQNMSSTELLEAAALQNELDNIYEETAIVRSRQKWMKQEKKILNISLV